MEASWCENCVVDLATLDWSIEGAVANVVELITGLAAKAFEGRWIVGETCRRLGKYGCEKDEEKYLSFLVHQVIFIAA